MTVMYHAVALGAATLVGAKVLYSAVKGRNRHKCRSTKTGKFVKCRR